MKKIHILLALFCIIAFSSCEDFLDKKPTNSGDAATSIQTAADAQVMINGIMSKMTSSNYLGRNMFLYADTKGGDLTIKSQGRGMDGLYTFNHAANSGSYSGFWTTGYNIILQLNNLLDNIERIEQTETNENFDDAKGQCLTLRAMLYFDLVRLYGKPYNYNKDAWGVPDITEVLDASDKKLRATVAQNYATIVKDLQDAERIIGTSKNNGYINYYGNKALQARVYLSMDDFDNALLAAQEVMKGPYTLYSPDKWVESWSSQFGSESIFELAMLDNEGDLGTASLGGYYARQGDYGTVLGYFMASDYFMTRLGEDPDDIRWGIMTSDETSDTRLGCCYKYLGSVDKDGDGKASASAVNIKVIRLSEIYLIAAEAALRKGSPDKTAAKDYLNEIRKRSPNLALANENTITLDMILDEKSKELYGEGHRFFDMIRCNKQIEFNDEFPGIEPPRRPKIIDRTFNLAVLPIFEAEMNANPGIKDQQNPGY